MATFSKKAYIEIARTLRAWNCTTTTDPSTLIFSLADIFAADNKAFDRERFLRACGL